MSGAAAHPGRAAARRHPDLHRWYQVTKVWTRDASITSIRRRLATCQETNEVEQSASGALLARVNHAVARVVPAVRRGRGGRRSTLRRTRPRDSRAAGPRSRPLGGWRRAAHPLRTTAPRSASCRAGPSTVRACSSHRPRCLGGRHASNAPSTCYLGRPGRGAGQTGLATRASCAKGVPTVSRPRRHHEIPNQARDAGNGA